MAVTQADIARLTGLTQRTVSRCFLEPEKVRKSTLERVLKVAEALNYRPNLAARSMRSGRFNNVVFLNDDHPFRTSFNQLLIKNVYAVLHAADLHLTFAQLPADVVADETRLPGIFNQLMADGILMNFHGILPNRLEENIQRVGLPCVWLNTKRASDCVHPDDLGCAVKSTEDLLTMGHRRIIYVDFAFHEHPEVGLHYSRIDRLEGYRRAMLKAGLTPQVVTPGKPSDPEGHHHLARNLLVRSDRPTAVIAVCPADLMVFYYQALARLRLEVPRQLSLLCFGERFGTFAGLRLSTNPVPFDAVGAEAAGMLIRRLEEPDARQPPRLVPYPEPIGETCVPPEDR